MEDLKANTEINKIFEQSQHLVVDLPKNASRSVWVDAANEIEAALRKI